MIEEEIGVRPEFAIDVLTEELQKLQSNRIFVLALNKQYQDEIKLLKESLSGLAIELQALQEEMDKRKEVSTSRNPDLFAEDLEDY